MMNISRVRYLINEHLCNGITKDTMLLFLDDLDNRARRGDKYKKICEVLVERYGYAYVHNLIDKTVEEVSQVREIMAKLRGEFFGSETRDEKLTSVIDMVRELDVHPKRVDDIISALMDLRDEEENI